MPEPHIPVLLRPLMAEVSPVSGVWLDGTFGAGSYTRALLDAGADQVIAVDRDPSVFEMARSWADDYGDRLRMVAGTFDQLDEYTDEKLDGVVLDLGVSSMQLDQPERGFSFMADGPLDMRMGDTGPNAADLVNGLDEQELADILFYFGEERASRRIARTIVQEAEKRYIGTTLELVEIIERCLPRPKPGQSHPATRSFQALRIAVNGEYEQLADGLSAAERALKPGGLLAVVTFHSIEDRMVKRFFQDRAGQGGQGNRYAPAEAQRAARFRIKTRRAVGPDDQELAENPRSRSAKLRVASRTCAEAGAVERSILGMPILPKKGARR
ncbi:16S rRNA (cytosine(1402)-N(4))-methyltransferase RsmH [Candidatus Rhodobacter oscarellae]|nr:16S rRNA (cytosine(1402)-N(4))-methyltransferase RsmH [Candidatus Rhodobacter lobularis]